MHSRVEQGGTKGPGLGWNLSAEARTGSRSGVRMTEGGTLVKSAHGGVTLGRHQGCSQWSGIGPGGNMVLHT